MDNTTTTTTLYDNDDQIVYLDLNGNTMGSSSLYDPSYTYSYDKYSCVRGFFFAHLVFK